MASVEISWFGALCDDDYEQLGVRDPSLLSSYDHCREIVQEAERQGFDAVLLPSGYELGLDATVMAAALCRATSSIRLLMAVRTGENWPPQLARQIATLQHVSDGRLDLNLISSDLAGDEQPSSVRYQRTLEVMTLLDDLLRSRAVDHHGEIYDVTVNPPRIASGSRPAYYFGGLSPDARDVAARRADVYLMWPDTEPAVAALIADMRERAASYGRTLRFGYRVHVVVRESASAARAAAQFLVDALDDDVGRAIRDQSRDVTSVGVARQGELRDAADNDGYVEPTLWTGIGRARSGCGAAIVGSPEQVLDKLRVYREMGIEAFILSGYPHVRECRYVGELVLPHIAHAPLS
jgi:alkanesulfonate monooxygenase